MRRRSATNSHPGEDLAFRRGYADANPWCELSPWLAKNFPKLGLTRWEPTAEVHHLWGTRRDCLTNLLCVCRTAHAWCHANPQEGRLLCMWVKCCCKREFCEDEYRAISGKIASGWITYQYPSRAELIPVWEETMAYFGNAAE